MHTTPPKENLLTPAKADAPPLHFNDDDWYVVDTFTWTVARVVGAKAGYKPTPGPGQQVMSGMKAKYANLR